MMEEMKQRQEQKTSGGPGAGPPGQGGRKQGGRQVSMAVPLVITPCVWEDCLRLQQLSFDAGVGLCVLGQNGQKVEHMQSLKNCH